MSQVATTAIGDIPLVLIAEELGGHHRDDWELVADELVTRMVRSLFDGATRLTDATLAALRRFNVRPWVTAEIGSVVATTSGARWDIQKVSDRSPSKQSDKSKTSQRNLARALRGLVGQTRV